MLPGIEGIRFIRRRTMTMKCLSCGGGGERRLEKFQGSAILELRPARPFYIDYIQESPMEYCCELVALNHYSSDG